MDEVIFEEGDEVRYKGDIEQYIKSFQPILKRRGIVVRGVLPEDYRERKYRPHPDKVNVKWIAKTSRGRDECHFMKPSELELVKKKDA